MANALKEPQASLVYFVVRDEDSKADIVFQTADTTWQVSKSSDILRLKPFFRRTTCTVGPMCTMVLSLPIAEPTKSPTIDRSKREPPGQ